ncbi:PTS sugar transporter subunit IIA [Methylocystis sp. B8]|uniref:PTS sugar transporter subunit IIA n=1 Tax=Methylocystis sp. B8 TaxID=544938 RepID=UPI0010FD2C92|nr:PTS sugar transporter subunit IIA [Methylocystis sp. B8]TLG73728.1 PTS sugar transporter subunit IIA [Methylocystis sp. B8]
MLDTTEIAIFAAVGVVFALGLIALCRWSGVAAQRIAAYALIALSFLYVGFAFRAEEPGAWVGVEMTGVAVFGSLAGMSIIGSPWWVVAGFALHPLYAIYFHYIGAGSQFAPPPFAIANAAFDVAMALFVAYAALRGAGRKTTGAADAPAPQRKLAARSQHRSQSRDAGGPA